MHHVLQEISKACIKAMIGALLMTIFSFILIYRILRKRGELQAETKQVRGDKLSDIKTVRRLITQSKNISDLHIAGLPMPAHFEVRHIFVHGTIGSGKSVFSRP